jgi:glucose/mannose-6-phosphate isomerase
MNLDDLQAIATLDDDHMLDRIMELPDQCGAAWQQTETLAFPPRYAGIEHLVIVGMGGSAIGGTLLQGLVSDECDVSITIVRDYSLPAFVAGSDCLVIACSYSGNTEETLSSFQQALNRDARVIAITTGGRLSELAGDAGAPVVRFSYQSQPRAALGYSFVLLLGTVHRLGLIPDYAEDVAEAVAVMEAWQQEVAVEMPTAENAAKQLAGRIEGQFPVVYGARFLAAAANRWKTQFNENAKSWAFFEGLPELNHNAVVGLRIPHVAREGSAVIMLRSESDPARIARRWDVTGELLAREGVTVEEVWGRGNSELSQMLSLIQFGDYVSFYLAMLNGVDPTPVENIAFLKRRLAELGKTAE